MRGYGDFILGLVVGVVVSGLVVFVVHVYLSIIARLDNIEAFIAYVTSH